MLNVEKFIKFEWTKAGEDELALQMPCGTQAQITGTTLELRLPERRLLRMVCPTINHAKTLAVEKYETWMLQRWAKRHRSGPQNTLCIPLKD